MRTILAVESRLRHVVENVCKFAQKVPTIMAINSEKTSPPKIIRTSNVLIIEDDQDTAETITVALVREGFGVRAVNSRDAAAMVMSTYLYDVVIMDFFMPGMGPEEFMRSIRQRNPHSQFILITATAEAAEKAKALGICHWIGKPFEIADLIDAVEDCSRR